MVDPQPSAQQINSATAGLKGQDQALFVPDCVYGDPRLWRMDAPIMQATLELVGVTAGWSDPLLAFRLLTPIVALVYMIGMYVLVYYQCRSWAASAFVSVLSTAVIQTFGWGSWGVGALASTTPATMIQAVMPFIVLAYLRYSNQWRVLLVFAFVGLCANLHLATAVNLAIVLMLAYLVHMRGAWRAWAMAAAGAGLAILAAMPRIAYLFALRRGIGHTAADEATAAAALHVGGLDVLYPGLLAAALELVLPVVTLAVPSLAVLARLERFRTRNLLFWAAMLAASLVAAFGLQGLSQAVAQMASRPAVISFAGAMSLAMLPLYVLFAQGLVNLFRIVQRSRVWLQWACAIMMLFWLGAADNVRPARLAIYASAGTLLREEYLPRNIRRHAQQARELADLAAISAWLQANTPIDAAVLTDLSQVRMQSRRAIVASQDDVQYYYNLAPGWLGGWLDRLKHVRSVLNPPAGALGPTVARQLVLDLAKQPRLAEASQWYLIAPAAAAATAESGPLEKIDGPWGSAYVLYRVR